LYQPAKQPLVTDQIIVIDVGSYKTKAGFGTEENPSVIFQSAVSSIPGEVVYLKLLI
jgi:actin-related protein